MSSDTSTTAAEAANTKWSKTADRYARYFEPCTLVAGRFLLNCMKIVFHTSSTGKGLTIVEGGAGGGALAKELLQLHGLELERLYVTDVSDGMLAKARERLATKQDNSNLNVSVEKQDFTNFQFESGSIDRYYANMCLHYARDPDVVIREAYRILKPQGIAGFTVWGRPSESEAFTIVPDVLKELALEEESTTPKRSSFHMGQDDEAVRKKFFDAGFSRCTCLHYPGVLECFSAEDFCELIIDGSASTQEQILAMPVDDQLRVRDEVTRRAKVILDQGRPIQLDILIIVAQK